MDEAGARSRAARTCSAPCPCGSPWPSRNTCPYVIALMSVPFGMYLRTSLLATMTYVACPCGTYHCVLVPSLPVFTSGAWQGLDLLGDGVDSAEKTLVLEGHEVAVEADQEVDVPLPRLRLGPDAVDEDVGAVIGTNTASTSPLKPLKTSFRMASCSAIAPYWPKKAVTLPAFWAGPAIARLAPARPPSARAHRRRPARTSGLRLSSGLVPDGQPAVVVVSAHGSLLCRYAARDAARAAARR